MSDLRALMKQRTAEKRIQHPYAKYNTRNELTCSICHLPIKSEVLWPSHLTSKVHRSNLKKEKDLELARQQKATSIGEKRGIEETGDDQDDEEQKRIKIDGNGEAQSHEETSVGQATGSNSILPPGFFSDPSQAPALTAPVEEEDEEWAAFEATLADQEPEAQASTSYAAATITAEEVLYENEEGETVEGKKNNAITDEENVEPEEEVPEETEEERQDREEREELMERIETEEREQQEADERVEALKKRLQTLKSSKATAKDVKSNKPVLNGGEEVNGDAHAIESARGRRGRRARW